MTFFLRKGEAYFKILFRGCPLDVFFSFGSKKSRKSKVCLRWRGERERGKKGREKGRLIRSTSTSKLAKSSPISSLLFIFQLMKTLIYNSLQKRKDLKSCFFEREIKKGLRTGSVFVN